MPASAHHRAPAQRLKPKNKLLLSKNQIQHAFFVLKPDIFRANFRDEDDGACQVNRSYKGYRESQT